MDVKQPEIQRGDSLPLTDRIYRYGVDSMIEKENKYTPTIYFFDLSKADIRTNYSLSVDWERKTSPEDTIIRIGCSYKLGTVIFKNYTNRMIYALDLKFIDSLAWILNTKYEPTFHQKEKLGSPNNPAHSLIFFDKNEYALNRPALLTELRNHAKDKKIAFDKAVVEEAVEKYRKSGK